MINLKDVLSKQQCLGFIDWAESLNFEDNSSKPLRERGNDALIIFEDQKLSDKIWEKVSHRLPSENNFGKANGLNDYFRLYRFLPGMTEQLPERAKYVRSPNETAVFTLIIFLNSKFEAAEIITEGQKIIPETGMSLIFDNSEAHSFLPLTKGIKYELRTDVVYRR